ncbi:hypothetical protein [Actinoplanes sp. NPDC020271]|uniref:hypothetical protein n=1 Tax=Actinoplanes sp. NPDC020271 TaxID=3363896 RepID=UPI0037AC11AB
MLIDSTVRWERSPSLSPLVSSPARCPVPGKTRALDEEDTLVGIDELLERLGQWITETFGDGLRALDPGERRARYDRVGAREGASLLNASCGVEAGATLTSEDFFLRSGPESRAELDDAKATAGSR